MTSKLLQSMKLISIAATIALILPSLANAGDYKSDPKTFAKSYKHITIEPVWDKKNPLTLIRPVDFRFWVYLGAPFTPDALNNGKANFPEFHNVYVQPEALKHYRKHGVWPEGTMMLKELQRTDAARYKKQGAKIFEDGSRYETSGRGYFPGPVNGMDVAVKDSTRFKESKNWGYFNFGHHAAPYAKKTEARSIGECAGCHIANADEDMVYMEMYRPIVNPLSDKAAQKKLIEQMKK